MKKYAVMVMHTTIEINFMGMIEKISLNYAKGMVGAMPIFDTKKQAEELAGNNFKVIELSLQEDEK